MERFWSFVAGFISIFFPFARDRLSPPLLRFYLRLRPDDSRRSVHLLCNFVHRFGEGYVAFLRFSQPITATDLRKAVRNYLPQAVVSSRQGSAARLLIPRSQDMPVSVSFNKLKLLADELKATDYTLTQSSLDQARIVKLTSVCPGNIVSRFEKLRFTSSASP